MPDDLSYNHLLGRPWIHKINGVPSTLHRVIKYVYNNKFYRLKANTEPKIFLMDEREGGDPLEALESSTP